MAPEFDPDDERPGSDDPLPPEDRLWRHPSEIGSGVAPPAAWFAPTSPPAQPPSAPSRRVLVMGAMAGACLTGALVAVAAMWVTRPTKVVQQQAAVTTVRSTSPARLTYAAMPTEEMASALAPSLPGLSVEHGGQWTSGSGVWLDAKGTVVTAAPLVAGAGTIIVTGRDGVGRAAEVVGSDDASGITVLRVAATSGDALDVDTATARAGEPVILVGAPGTEAGGSSDAATTAMAVIRVPSMRSAVGELVVHDAVQLDREVPADAVGGILVDGDGRLVGIALGTSSDRGLGVVIPGAEALDAARSLRDDGKVVRAWLGVKATDLDPLAATLLGVAGGATLTDVSPGSPAAQAGLEVGDVVTAVGGRTVHDATDLVLALRHHDPGDRITITRTHEGEPDQVQATLTG